MRTTTRTMLAASAAAAVFAGGAVAQTNGTFLLVSTNTGSPRAPTTTIEVWATWVSPDYLFAGADYDLTAGDGEFTGGELILGNDPPNTMGVLSGRTVIGAAMGQIHGILGIFGNEDKPILLATYDWTTTDFTSRTVSLDTSNTSIFIVGLILNGVIAELFPHEFTPGSGAINVVHAPSAAGAGVLAIVLCAAGRRRRTVLRGQAAARSPGTPDAPDAPDAAAAAGG